RRIRNSRPFSTGLSNGLSLPPLWVLPAPRKGNSPKAVPAMSLPEVAASRNGPSSRQAPAGGWWRTSQLGPLLTAHSGYLVPPPSRGSLGAPAPAAARCRGGAAGGGHTGPGRGVPLGPHPPPAPRHVHAIPRHSGDLQGAALADAEAAGRRQAHRGRRQRGALD